MKQLLENNPIVLMEAAVVEQLRRSENIQLHHTLANAPLIYDETAQTVMGEIYKTYIQLAQQAHLPILICTPTWRANKDRVQNSDVRQSVNEDAVSYMQTLRESAQNYGDRIKIGGMLGCKNDCYRPEEGLSAAESQHFHSWQIEQLNNAGIDFLIAETLPNVQEALGIALAMESTGTPYIISFVIARDGKILDGSSLDAAIDLIDSSTKNPPLGYMVNCAHPSFLCPEKQTEKALSRLIGYQANASSLDHCDLDKADELKTDSVSEWGELMLQLNETFGTRILGGCCGTGPEHLQYIIENKKP